MWSGKRGEGIKRWKVFCHVSVVYSYTPTHAQKLIFHRIIIATTLKLKSQTETDLR